MGQRGSKLLQITKYPTFWHFKGIFTSKNLVLNAFFGSTNLWRLLGEHRPLGVLLCYYMGLLSGSEGLKIAPNTKYLTSGHFKGIFTSKNLVLNTFSGSTNLWRLLGEYEPLGVLLC